MRKLVSRAQEAEYGGRSRDRKRDLPRTKDKVSRTKDKERDVPRTRDKDKDEDGESTSSTYDIDSDVLDDLIDDNAYSDSA